MAKCNDNVVWDNHGGEYEGSNVDFEKSVMKILQTVLQYNIHHIHCTIDIITIIKE